MTYQIKMANKYAILQYTCREGVTRPRDKYIFMCRDMQDCGRVYACSGIPGPGGVYPPLTCVVVYLRKCYFQKIENEIVGLS